MASTASASSSSSPPPYRSSPTSSSSSRAEAGASSSWAATPASLHTEPSVASSGARSSSPSSSSLSSSGGSSLRGWAPNPRSRAATPLSSSGGQTGNVGGEAATATAAVRRGNGGGATEELGLLWHKWERHDGMLSPAARTPPPACGVGGAPSTNAWSEAPPIAAWSKRAAASSRLSTHGTVLRVDGVEWLEAGVGAASITTAEIEFPDGGGCEVTAQPMCWGGVCCANPSGGKWHRGTPACELQACIDEAKQGSGGRCCAADASTDGLLASAGASTAAWGGRGGEAGEGESISTACCLVGGTSGGRSAEHVDSGHAPTLPSS
mmetsp:Transcript_36360/g.83338  ORF Transcript_36360/g.83338 Transcript_36360/m.83338 type:complete len:323 (+) Transcript_36360:1684-2652(+)